MCLDSNLQSAFSLISNAVSAQLLNATSLRQHIVRTLVVDEDDNENDDDDDDDDDRDNAGIYNESDDD